MTSIQEYTREDCDQALAQLARTYDLNRPITHFTDDVDRVVNQLAELLDQQDYLVVKERMKTALDARWGATTIDTDLEID